MSTSTKKVFLAAAVCAVAVFVLGLAGNVLFGEAEGGGSDLMHFAQMGFLLATPILLVVGAIKHFGGRANRSA